MNAATEQYTASPEGNRPIREELRGRGIGMVILGLFGLSWASWGLSADVANAVVITVSVLADIGTVATIIGAIVLFRRSTSAPSGVDSLRGRRVGRRFGLIVAAEFIGIFIVARVLAVTGHTELIPALICLGVGIHFFPLRRLFHLPLYGATATALCLITVATFILAPLTGRSALWTQLPGFGAAIVLYTTCALLFRGVSPKAQPAAGNGPAKGRPQSS